ncbi:MAG TPA: response regulator [Pyrinomonadaceae bacterium]|nr:response regulator [Pyrinomonadaceae bacterium]
MNRDNGDRHSSPGFGGDGATAGDASARRPRRALVCAGPSVAAMLERQLRTAGYATVVASASDAPKAVSDFAPNVVLVGLHNGTDGERVALARRLRAAPSTYGLPLVFLYHKDERAHRSAALQIGADDYFSLATPPAELCARLDALFWRAEAGRRAAPVVGERRAEIDNFMLLLDAVRDDFEQGSEGGALAIVEARPGASGDGAGDASGGASNPSAGTLAEAHGFFKLNLRRADSVAFYGPTLLLVYLPRLTLEEARASLARLCGEFARRHAGRELSVGLAAFPAEGVSDVETLVEHAEQAAADARSPEAPSHVLTHDPARQTSAPANASVAGNVSPNASAPTTKDNAKAGEAKATDGRGVGGSQATNETRAGASEQPGARGAGASERPAAPSSAFSEKSSAPGEKSSESAARLFESAARSSRESAPAPFVERRRSRFAAPKVEEVDAWTRRSAEAGARELERRARGAVMPRRLLLAVSDPARMAQLNLLVRSAGYDVRAAFDAQQALSLLRIERPDLVVLDFELQGMDGLEALRRLRQQSGGRPQTPAVILYDARREDARRQALEAGAQGAVALPCDPSDFLEAVRRAGSVD